MLWVSHPKTFPREQREQLSCSCSWSILQTFPRVFPKPSKNQSLFSCFSIFARRGFPTEGLGGSPTPPPPAVPARTQPCSTQCLPPPPAAPSAPPPSPLAPRAGPFTPRQGQIRAILSPHCVELELLSQPFDHVSPPSG